MRICTALAAGLWLSTSLSVLLPETLPAQEPAAELEEICAGEQLTFSLPPLRLFDQDHDLLISRDEAGGCASLARMFSRLDLDASDTLTQAEYDGFPDLWRRRVITLRDEPEADED